MSNYTLIRKKVNNFFQLKKTIKNWKINLKCISKRTKLEYKEENKYITNYH